MENAPLPVLAIGSDHAGFPLKSALLRWLRESGYEVIDVGVHAPERCDYPDFAHKLCKVVEDGAARFGILVCGTGIGVSMAANRHPGIRCALVSEPVSAHLARAHNDANVVAVGGRMIGEEMAIAILKVFLSAAFEGGRHAGRVAKINLSSC
jgi:ribose 5-phosphate isomerase B